ncbi:MAG: PIG-L family deacetylase [Betaproteobacteria bacterium]|nr:MAG: PIG-L family deacetylase [Betaproteobacteria bacterium]TMH93353.1 MAG: PIG-L family deacetylase [Betaproteobacteria bacterium]HYW98387.1 PIG-L deacetylase family protein [Candidatus Elarobacter sp.]
MLNLTFERRRDSIFRILCLGAHSDDIEIGCGGTVLRILEENPDAEVLWVVIGASGQRADEATASAKSFLARARQKEVIVKEFRDGFFPYIGAEIKGFFEELKRRCAPDLILTHCRNDLHQDHRLVSELTWNTFRNHLILEYEILKYDGDLGTPNVFVHLTESLARRKVGILLDSFRSQVKKNWFTEDAFLAILRLRGLECNAPEKYAEAYHARKLVL